MSRKSVAVQIAGHEYKIRSDSEEGSVRDIAGYVDQAMKRVREGTGTADTLDVAVLTCLNLAREILALRDRNRKSREELQQQGAAVDDGRLQALIERVEAATIASSAAGIDVKTSWENAPETIEAAAETQAAPKASSEEFEKEASVRTLDLASIEEMRERNQPDSGGVGNASLSEAASDGSSEAMPEAKIAAGGRERAS